MTINRAMRELTRTAISRAFSRCRHLRARNMPRQTSMIEIMNIADEIAAIEASVIHCKVILAAQTGHRPALNLPLRFELAEGGMACLPHRRRTLPRTARRCSWRSALRQPGAGARLHDPATSPSRTPTEYLLEHFAAVEQVEHVVRRSCRMPVQRNCWQMEARASPVLQLVHRRILVLTAQGASPAT